jgi:hypothetical protein
MSATIDLTPFQRFRAYVEEADRILYLSMRGIARAIGEVELAESFMRLEPRDLDPIDREREGPDPVIEGQRNIDLEQLKKEAEFAQLELDRGFPLLYAHTVVGLWGALEVLVEDFAVSWLRDHPELLRQEQISKVKISLGEYESLPAEERVRYLVVQLQREMKADIRTGISSFESLLSVLNLSGPVDDATRRNLFEMHNTRNVIVHRGAVADQRFVSACAWKELDVGDDVRVSKEDYVRFREALIDYAKLLFGRVQETDKNSSGTAAISEGISSMTEK